MIQAVAKSYDLHWALSIAKTVEADEVELPLSTESSHRGNDIWTVELWLNGDVSVSINFEVDVEAVEGVRELHDGNQSVELSYALRMWRVVTVCVQGPSKKSTCAEWIGDRGDDDQVLRDKWQRVLDSVLSYQHRDHIAGYYLANGEDE